LTLYSVLVQAIKL